MSSHAARRQAFGFRLGARVPVALLVALLAVDLVLITTSVVRLAVHGPSLTDPWLLETDDGWAEVFGYLQQATIAVLLLGLAFAARRWIFAAFATVYVCALADDSLRLHERKGAWLADRLGHRLWFPENGLFGLRADDLGEMLFWGLMTVVPLTAVVLLYLRGDAATRRTARVLAALLGAYIFVGGVLDQLHVLVMDTWFGGVMSVLEDGGELVVLSVTLVCAVALLRSARAERRSPAPVPQAAPRSLAPPAPAA
jgi:hypothetical protein